MHRIQRIKVITPGFCLDSGATLENIEMDAVFYGDSTTAHLISNELDMALSLFPAQYTLLGESKPLSPTSESAGAVSISDVIGQDMKSLNIEFK